MVADRSCLPGDNIWWLDCRYSLDTKYTYCKVSLIHPHPVIHPPPLSFRKQMVWHLVYAPRHVCMDVRTYKLRPTTTHCEVNITFIIWLLLPTSFIQVLPQALGMGILGGFLSHALLPPPQAVAPSPLRSLGTRCTHDHPWGFRCGGSRTTPRPTQSC